MYACMYACITHVCIPYVCVYVCIYVRECVASRAGFHVCRWFVVRRYKIPELADILKDEEAKQKKVPVSTAQLGRLSYHVERLTEFDSVWKSRGLGTRMRLAVYSPVTKFSWVERAFNGHRLILPFGCYANTDFRHPPASANCFTLQIKDDAASFGSRSEVTVAGRAKHFPPPKRFHQVWSTNRKGKPLYAWSPVPPSEEFVALGMVFTTVDSPPPLDSACCVALRVLQVSAFKPQLVWTDKGSTGRPGSCWVVNELKLVHMVQGHEEPKGPFYDFKVPTFVIKEDGNVAAAAAAAGAGGGAK
jgi:hypothetical protein